MSFNYIVLLLTKMRFHKSVLVFGVPIVLLGASEKRSLSAFVGQMRNPRMKPNMYVTRLLELIQNVLGAPRWKKKLI